MMQSSRCCRLNNSPISSLLWSSLFAILPLTCYSFTSPTLFHSHTIAHGKSGLPSSQNSFVFALSAKRSGFSPEKVNGGGSGGVGAKRDGGLLSAVSVASTQDYSSRLLDDSTTLTTTNNVDLPFASSSNDVYLTPSSSMAKTNNMALASSSESLRTIVQDYIAPVLSAAMLITGNTIGAGMLVLPELAAGPGLAVSTGIFVVCYALNLLSGLVLAQVAILQYEQQETQGNNHPEDTAVETAQATSAVPSSFQELAQVNVSPAIAPWISMASLFVNACVMTFAFTRVGLVGSTVFSAATAAVVVPSPVVVSLGFAGLLTVALASLNVQKLSHVASFCVTALFVSLAGLLGPGVAAVLASNDSTWTSLLTQPGLYAISNDLSLIQAISQAAPVMLMALVYQNIVPTICKLLNYHRGKTVAAITLGSFVPLVLYWLFCFATLGGGMGEDLAQNHLFGMFSLATLSGCGLSTTMSLAEEVDSFLKRWQASSNDQEDKSVATVSTEAEVYQLPSVALSVVIPLAVAHAMSATGQDLTQVLAVAGSFGSPLLYGALPAFMAWNQQIQNSKSNDSNTQPLVVGGESLSSPNFSSPFSVSRHEQSNNKNQNLVPSMSLGILGILSTTFVGEELFHQFVLIFG